ncbi:MAG: hypothetical protein SFV81_11235 [Pirellulaceae bacterium]|nr:hypothetical protein [Pirellulaceae bacterium]
MEARRIRPTALGMATVVAIFFSTQVTSQVAAQIRIPVVAQVAAHQQPTQHAVEQHVAHSPNFIVFAGTPQLAAQVSQAAEDYRSKLAIYWLGKELPAWSQRCPVHVVAKPHLGAGGETRFSPIPGGVGNWMMQVQGTEERVLDSVLPHEITHTIFATHFAPYNRVPPFDRYLPRWADEGACTTVEHIEEKSKHQHFLQQFLRTGRGIAFNKMFGLKEYPKDILPLYAQGHSVVQFLLDQGGPRKFVGFLEEGMSTGSWQVAMKNHYEYETIGELQTQWNRWLRDGSPTSLVGYAPSLRGDAPESAVALASASLPSTSPSAQLASAQANTKLGSFERRSPTPQILNPQAPNSQVVAQTTPSPLKGLEGASYASGDSWYRSRLRAVSSGPVPSVEKPGVEEPTGQPMATNLNSMSTLRAIEPTVASREQVYPAAQPHKSARQSEQRPQRNSIRVLDWGNSEPVAGIATGPEMVPLR